MANGWGTSTGIGIGIGEALGDIGQGFAIRGQRREAQREKQAAAFEKQMQDVAGNIQLLGGENAAAAAPYVQQLNRIVDLYNGLYAPHETPKLLERMGRLIGRQPQQPQARKRSPYETTVQAQIAQAPVYQPGRGLDLQSEIAQMKQAYLAAHPGTPDPEAGLAAFNLVVNSRQTSSQNVVDQMNQHAAAYKIANAGKVNPATGQPYTDAELTQQGRQDFMQTGPRGAQPRYTLQGTLGTDPKTGESVGLFINPQNPQDYKIERYPPGAYTPKPTKAGAWKPEYRKDAAGADVLTRIVGADGKVYDAANIDSEDVPADIKAYWDHEQGRLQDVAAQKRVDLAQKQDFQVKLAKIRNDLTVQRIPFEEQKSYDIREFGTAQSELAKSQDAFNKTKDLWAAADNADKARNAQADLLFVEALQKEVASGRSSQGSIEGVMTHGTLKQRLGDIYSQTLGGQQMDDVIRENLIEVARTLYNSRLDNVNANRQTVERIRARTQGGGGGGGGGGAAQPHTKRWARDAKGGIVEQFGPNDWRYVKWDGKQWVDTGQRYTAPTK